MYQPFPPPSHARKCICTLVYLASSDPSKMSPHNKQGSKHKREELKGIVITRIYKAIKRVYLVLDASPVNNKIQMKLM